MHYALNCLSASYWISECMQKHSGLASLVLTFPLASVKDSGRTG